MKDNSNDLKIKEQQKKLSDLENKTNIVLKTLLKKSIENSKKINKS